jgi:hypothetical protein
MNASPSVFDLCPSQNPTWAKENARYTMYIRLVGLQKISFLDANRQTLGRSVGKQLDIR